MSDLPGPSRLVHGLTLLSGGALLLVVLGAATVAMLAEFAKTWQWYFRMEQAMELAMPATLVLLGLFVTGLVGMVVLADRD
ncbi:hypothetical protein DU504_12085 [Haloplanus salinus]|jgi:hypothetical protein|uniref:Uncharacterized protein n=1 Tax=Haloplanus salinus TaxID=1126245 RepID=A0A368NBM4_9EURY|nr:hypothetical protein [Haloplanus salinus]RCU47972.1 hypothetical protein DU504_12085 [Haloplanus salinus]